MWIEDALIIFFVFLAGPVSTYVLVWAAVARNIRPSSETVGQPVVRPIEQVDVEEGPTDEGRA
jgi:multisubunit Na+/H+ antiporter MnhG subunit